jgi:ABC-type sugar transport system ATPase subunit
MHSLKGRGVTAPVLEMSGVTKTFGSTQAMVDVSLTLYPGSIHALVGENGAGKSTLIKTMTGIHRPSSGTIRVNGQMVSFAGTGDASAPAWPRSTRSRWSFPI